MQIGNVMQATISTEMIRRAQLQDKDAMEVIMHAAKTHAKKLVYRYAHRNLLVEADDIIPIFMTKVFQEIPSIRLDVGDPCKHLISQAEKRTLLEVTKVIKEGTQQQCNDCGHSQNIHYTPHIYTCAHPKDACPLMSTVYKKDADCVKQEVSSQFFDIGLNCTLCRRAKSMNKNKVFYCMHDFIQYIQLLQNDCMSHKDEIIHRLVQIVDGDIAEAQRRYTEGVQIVRVQKFHAQFFPSLSSERHKMLNRVTIAIAGRKQQCTKCGSFQVTTFMPNKSDEISSPDGGTSSIAEDMTICSSSMNEERILGKIRILSFIETLFGQEKLVMVRLLKGYQSADIAAELGVSLVSISIYKSRAVHKAAQFFYEDFIDYIPQCQLDDMISKHSLMIV